MLIVEDHYDPDGEDVLYHAAQTGLGRYKLHPYSSEFEVSRTWPIGLVQWDNTTLNYARWEASTPEARLWLLMNLPPTAAIVEDTP